MDTDLEVVELDEFVAAAARYIPDLTFPRNLQGVLKDQESQKMSIRALWIVSGAVPEIHGDLGRPQQTVVQI